jgi:hypothetical protein
LEAGDDHANTPSDGAITEVSDQPACLSSARWDLERQFS